jgi:hypothetical protein
MQSVVRCAPGILLIGLSIALSPGANAQDATPGAQQAGRHAAHPTIGTAVTYADADGVEQGAVTVAKIDDPFTGYPTDKAPAAGRRYVVAYVAFEATGKKAFQIDPGHVLLRDTNGMLWARASVPRGDNPDIPDAESAKLAPGNKISGAIGFIIPDKAVAAQVYYQPQSGRLVLLADLGAKAGASGLNTPVKDIDADGVEHGAVTVTEVDDPFTGYPKDKAPAAGRRYVVVFVAFEATGTKAFQADPGHIVLRDANGFMWAKTSVPRGDNPDIPDAQSTKLAPGNKLSGAIGFIVPEQTPLAQIFYQPENSQLVLLADVSAR